MSQHSVNLSAAHRRAVAQQEKLGDVEASRDVLQEATAHILSAFDLLKGARMDARQIISELLPAISDHADLVGDWIDRVANRSKDN